MLEVAFVAPFASIFDPLGNGSSFAFFLEDAPLPDGPAWGSSRIRSKCMKRNKHLYKVQQPT